MSEQWLRLPLYEAFLDLLTGLDTIAEDSQTPDNIDLALTTLRRNTIDKLKGTGAMLDAEKRAAADTVQELRHREERFAMEMDALGVRIEQRIDQVNTVKALVAAEIALRDWGWRVQHMDELRRWVRRLGEGQQGK